MADGLNISPSDRDLAIRTIIGEAGGQDLEGMAGVANVIANRYASGKYGKSLADVVLAPNQFEPWLSRGAELLGYDPQGDAYRSAGGVLDGVLAGKVQDNTGGATHFFAPKLQAQLGRPVPTWAGQPTASIGGHLFYAPQGAVSRALAAPASEAINAVASPKAKTPTWEDVQRDAAQGDTAIAAAEKAGGGALPDGSKTGKRSYDALKALGVDVGGNAASPATPQAEQPAGATAAAPRRSYDALKALGVDIGDAAPTSPGAQPPGDPFHTDPTTGYVVSKNEAGYTSLTDPKSGRIVQQFAPGDYEARASKLGAFAGGAVSGIPIAGPAIAGGVERAAAAARAAANGTPFSQELANVQSDAARDAAVYPKTATAGALTGGALTLAPLAATGTGASLLGLTGSMGARTLLGGASGAAIGAADSAARGGSPLTGAAFGLFGGAGGPWAGRVIGGGVNRLTDAVQAAIPTGMTGISRSTANLANQFIDYAGGHQSVMDRANAFGPMAMPADVDPALTALAGGLAAKPGEAQSIIKNALTERAAGSSDRISDTLHDVVGPDPGSVNRLDRTYGGIRSVHDAASYPVIHATAPPVDASPVYATIDQQLQHATGPQRAILERFKNELDRSANVQPAVLGPNGEEITPEVRTWDSQTLHNIRQDLDSNMPDKELGVPLASISRKSNAVGSMRSALDSVLKSQVPGMAEADARSALNATNQGAVKEGYDSVMGANVPHPEDFAEARAGANPATNAAMNTGMASRIYRAFGTGTQRDAVTLNKLLAGGEDGFSAQNLGTAFSAPGPNGPVNRANALLDTLAREKAFNNTTNTVVNNSETASRQAVGKALDDTQPGNMSVLGATTAGMVAQPIKSLIFDPIIKAIMENPTAPRNVELARILIAQGGERGQFLQHLQRFAGRNALVDRIGRPAATALNAGANRLLLSGGLSAGSSQGQ